MNDHILTTLRDNCEAFTTSCWHEGGCRCDKQAQAVAARFFVKERNPASVLIEPISGEPVLPDFKIDHVPIFLHDIATGDYANKALQPGLHYGVWNLDHEDYLRAQIQNILRASMMTDYPLPPAGFRRGEFENLSTTVDHFLAQAMRDHIYSLGINPIRVHVDGKFVLFGQCFITQNGNIERAVINRHMNYSLASIWRNTTVDSMIHPELVALAQAQYEIDTASTKP